MEEKPSKKKDYTFLDVKTCPYCKKNIQYWSADTKSTYMNIGIPFIKCQHCNKYSITKKVKEINMMSKIDWFEYWFNRIWRITFISLN